MSHNADSAQTTTSQLPAPAVRRTRRQRRPTGAPPPLPRRIAPSTTAWLLLAAVILLGAFHISYWTAWSQVVDHAGTWLLRRLASARTPWLTDIANGINAAGSGWGVAVIGLVVLALIMVFRRWRHLLVFAGGLFILVIADQWIYFTLSRPRPYGVRIIGA